MHLRKVELPLGEDSDERAQHDSIQQIQKRRITEDGEGQVATEAHNPSSREGQDATKADGEEEDFEISNEDLELLKSMFGEDASTAVLALYKKILKHPNWKARDFTSVTSPPITDRAQRTQVHQSLRRIFSSRLESITDKANGSITIVAASKPNPRSNGRSAPTHTADGKPLQVHGRGKVAWDHLGGEYLHFTLAKQNKDTMEIVNFIASQLKLNSKYFHFAGTKDRRGVTVQRASGYRVQRDALARLNTRIYSAKVGDFEYKTDGLDLGQLGGNEFTITLRDCGVLGGDSVDVEVREEELRNVVQKRVKSFEENGWINYYGLQRFGSFTHGTETIGLKLLQGNFESAIDLILSYNPNVLDHDNSSANGLISNDDLKRAEALHIWTTRKNGRQALDKLPRRFNAESAIIKHLGMRDKKSSQMNRMKDFQGAISQIPRNLRLMYVHAYQSLVWNVVAGKRIEMFGTSVVAGDLVIIGDREKGQHMEESDGHSKDEMEVDEAGEVIVRPAAGDSAGDAPDKFTRARPLSQHEAESGKYNIFDVVLPLPGFDIEYPANAVGALYKEFMGSERGGGLDPHDMRRKWKDISLSGDYRKLMARPMASVGWEIRRYHGLEDQLVETELEKHLDKQEKPEKPADNGAGATEGQENEKGSKDERAGNDRIAVILKLQLGSSQYATMALRELTKGGTKSFRPEYGTSR